MGLCGAWRITEDAEKYPACNLPEELASAFTKLTKDLVGAKYEPLMNAAVQVVSGTNHMILCRVTLSDEEHTVKISTVTINMPVSGEPQILAVNDLF